MKIHAALLLCIVALAESRVQHQNRINYGAVFRHVGFYDNSGLSVLQVLNIHLWSTPQLHASNMEVTSLLQNLNQAFLQREHDVTPPPSVPLPSQPPGGSVLPPSPGASLTPRQRARLMHRHSHVSLATNHTVVRARGDSVQTHHDLNHTLSYVLRESEALLEGALESLWMEELLQGLRALLQMRLSPVLVPLSIMQSILDSVSAKVTVQRPHFRLAHLDFDFYFRYAVAEAWWDAESSTLVVAFNIPLTSHATRFPLFRVATHAVAVRQDSDNVTRLLGVPQFLAVRGDGEEAVEFSSEDLAWCSHAADLWRCSVSRPVVNASSASCLLAIFREDAFAVRHACTYEVVRDGLVPAVTEVLPSLVLLSRVDKHVLQCQDGSAFYQGCRQCLVRVPCRCTLLAGGFETAQRLHACPEDLGSKEAVVPLLTSNLGFLAKALPPHHALLDAIRHGGAGSNVSDVLVPAPPLGTLRLLAAAMGHPRLDARRAVAAELDVANSFADQWNRAVEANMRLYDYERYVTVGIFLTLLVVFAISCCIFAYQRRYLEVKLIRVELDHTDCCSFVETDPDIPAASPY